MKSKEVKKIIEESMTNMELVIGNRSDIKSEDNSVNSDNFKNTDIPMGNQITIEELRKKFLGVDLTNQESDYSIDSNQQEKTADNIDRDEAPEDTDLDARLVKSKQDSENAADTNLPEDLKVRTVVFSKNGGLWASQG